jgi:hypothetical protein
MEQQREKEEKQRRRAEEQAEQRKVSLATKDERVQREEGMETVREKNSLESKGGSVDLERKLAETEARCKQVEESLAMAEIQIVSLEQQAANDKEKDDLSREQMMLNFHDKETRLLQAASEESQHDLLKTEQRLQSEIHSLEEHIAEERNQFVKQQENYRQMIEQTESRAEQAEVELRNALKKQDGQFTQASQREKRALNMAEDKVAQTMAILDERNEEISHLKQLVKSLESSMNEHVEGAEEAEQEVEELQTENENLQEHVESMAAECSGLKAQIASLEAGAEKLGGLQMELTMLREERDRERAKRQNVVESAITSHSQVESERDAALAEVRDLKQQLTAALADLEVANADKARILTANNNLQYALEAFQDERQAEMVLLEEQRKEAEEAINAAHAAAMEATCQVHQGEMKHVQYASDSAVKNVMQEVHELEANLEKLRAENTQMRRSLDEAISRLQSTQEDVIDRTLMKNILLDWCTMKDKDKRHEVLQLLANVLHFSEEEKEKVHLTHMDIESVRDRFVGAFAAPLPRSKADVDHLEGSNVREKWVNFLLAETDDGS